MSTRRPFAKAQRLGSPAEFQAVFNLNRPLTSRSPFFTVLGAPSQGEYARLGMIVAKRNIKRAVQRNRIRRLIRESFRNHQAVLAGLDIVVIVKAEGSKRENAQLFLCLEKHWKELVAQWKNA